MPVRRGEIYWVDFHPARGSEQAGRRPALVVQNDRGNESSPTTVVAVLTRRVPSRPFPFIVALAAGEGGLREAGSVNCAQLLTVDQSRLERRIGTLSEERMHEVEAALRYELGLE
jgi:mRNA interferase MazF